MSVVGHEPAPATSAVGDWLRRRLDAWGVGADEAKLLGLCWATSRVWLLVVLLLVVSVRHFPALTAISTWDVQHFIEIARSGYQTPESRAFFPGVPGLMQAGELLGLAMPVTGVLVGLGGSALAAAALYRMGGILPAALWLLAPTTVFTFVGYTEAPFCAAAFWAWQRWRKGHYLSGALLASVACTFRISGLFLIGALALLSLLGDGREDEHLDARWGDRLRRLLWLGLPAAALLAHSWHLKLVTGTWTAWYDAQVSGWNRGLTPPWTALANTWDAAHPSAWPGRPEVPVIFFLEIVSMAVGLVAVGWLLRKRRWASAGWIAVQLVAFGTSFWYMSINRAVLLWFPLFLLVAELARRDDAPGARLRLDPPQRTVWPVAGWLILSSLAAGAWAWLLFTNAWAS